MSVAGSGWAGYAGDVPGECGSDSVDSDHSYLGSFLGLIRWSVLMRSAVRSLCSLCNRVRVLTTRLQAALLCTPVRCVTRPTPPLTCVIRVVRLCRLGGMTTPIVRVASTWPCVNVTYFIR